MLVLGRTDPERALRRPPGCHARRLAQVAVEVSAVAAANVALQPALVQQLQQVSGFRSVGSGHRAGHRGGDEDPHVWRGPCDPSAHTALPTRLCRRGIAGART